MLSRSTDSPEGTVPVIRQQWLPSESLPVNNCCRPNIRLCIVWLTNRAVKWTVRTQTALCSYRVWTVSVNNHGRYQRFAKYLCTCAAVARSFVRLAMRVMAAMSVCVSFYSHKKDRTQDLAWRIAGVSSKLKINDSIQFFFMLHTMRNAFRPYLEVCAFLCYFLVRLAMHFPPAA